MKGGAEDLDRSDVAWAAWRLADDGGIRVVVTLRADDGTRRLRRDYEDLDAAVAELGDSFRTVVEKVCEADGDRGRWRP